MSRTLATWRLAVRVGRRDVLRSRGRSALILTMIGTPVLLTVVLTTLVASNNLSAQERIADDMGSADAVATYLGGAVEQSPDGSDLASTGEPDERLETPEQQAAALQQAAGGVVQTLTRGFAATVVVGRQGYRSTWLAVDASSPAATGTYRLDSGRVPTAEDEVMVSSKLARHGATIGSTVEIDRGGALTVVGIGRTSSVLRGGDPQSVMVMPGVLTDGETSFLMDDAGPVDWSDVQKLNRSGFVVTSREVLAHPPADDAVSGDLLMSSADDATTRAVLAVVVTSIVLEVVLLAGPAFAVGVRRQRRDLALLASAGASPRQVRSMVLGQALVLGVLACMVGAGLGAALSALVVWLGPDVIPALAFGPFEVQWGFVAAAVLLGASASMIAAYVPAR
ncbi:MAG: ABC transporter permease, partial [Aeromicrobium sp.]